MDDPKFQDKRSTELNGFRKQFARHRSFTYGDTMKNLAPSAIGNPSFVKGSRAAAIKEEDSSFEGGSSPSAVQADAIAARRRMSQQQAGSGPSNEAHRAILPTLKPLGYTANGDISWTSSAGDSSFEGGPTDSPCAAAGSRKPSSLLPGPCQPTSGSLGRHALQRASTAGNVLHRGGSISPQQQQQQSSLWLNDEQQQQQQYANGLDSADPGALDATTLAQAASASTSASAFTPDDGGAESAVPAGAAGGAAGQGEDEPLYVNPKQYGRIIKRREARARMDEKRRKAEEAVKSGKISASAAAALAGREAGLVARGLLGHSERGVSSGGDGEGDARARGQAQVCWETTIDRINTSRGTNMRCGDREVQEGDPHGGGDAGARGGGKSTRRGDGCCCCCLGCPFRPEQQQHQQQQQQQNQDQGQPEQPPPPAEDQIKVETSNDIPDLQPSSLQDDEAQADDFLILE
ncbi:hypothetical protein L7F22_005886 [Adiantum nelumboides]|nr:hypothetical protein [Adiantum nelumboides]